MNLFNKLLSNHDLDARLDVSNSFKHARCFQKCQVLFVMVLLVSVNMFQSCRDVS